MNQRQTLVFVWGAVFGAIVVSIVDLIIGCPT